MKKLNKLVAILVAMAMVLSLTVISAFAAKDPNAQVSADGTDVNASVKKTLTVPTGTTVTGLTYGLVFTNTATPSGTTAPAISKTFSFAEVEGTPNGGTTTYVAQLDNILPAGTTWPAVGYYEYTVKEDIPAAATSENDYTVTAPDGKFETTTTYSAANYTLKVGIAQGANGKYIESVSVAKNKNDDGTDANGAKVPITADGTQFGFANNIVSKTIKDVEPGGEEGQENDDALEISKNVIKMENNEEVAYASSQEFAFTLNMTKPDNADAPETYAYTILKADGSEKTTGEVTTGTPEKFYLATGEKLVFTNISVGASYTVVEDTYPQYSTSDNMTTAVYIDDNGNAKNFKNIYDENKDPQTGLSIANLPFIVLALVAVGGLVAYVVVRRKSEDNA